MLALSLAPTLMMMKEGSSSGKPTFILKPAFGSSLLYSFSEQTIILHLSFLFVVLSLDVTMTLATLTIRSDLPGTERWLDGRMKREVEGDEQR